MAQDLPAEQPDLTLAPPSQAGTSERPDIQGSGEQNSCTDAAAPCISQNSSTNPQTASGDPQTPSDSAPPSRSISDGKDHFVHDFVGDFFHDEYRIWTGPFRGSSYSSHVMMKYGIPFIVISGALIATDRQTSHWFENTKGQVIWSGRVSQIGAPYTVAGISGATYLIGRATHNDHARETGFLALEAVADSQFITLVLKEITQRQRPLQGTQHGGFWQGGASFPSGHASGAFAVAAVFAYEYRDHIAVPITAYTLASIVGVSRLGAQQHWLSDIFVGSAVGFLAGRYVYKQHHDPSLPGSVTSKLRPQFAAREHGLGLYWDF
jgi:membrane-associated phospholipid phosphatase